MNLGSILDKIVGEAKPAKAPAAPKPKRPTIGDGAEHEPYNKCPHCDVVNAYCIVLPTGVHVRKPDGTIVVEYIGEGYFECKYCHAVDHKRGKGKNNGA